MEAGRRSRIGCVAVLLLGGVAAAADNGGQGQAGVREPAQGMAVPLRGSARALRGTVAPAPEPASGPSWAFVNTIVGSDLHAAEMSSEATTTSDTAQKFDAKLLAGFPPVAQTDSSAAFLTQVQDEMGQEQTVEDYDINHETLKQTKTMNQLTASLLQGLPADTPQKVEVVKNAELQMSAQQLTNMKSFIQQQETQQAAVDASIGSEASGLSPQTKAQVQAMENQEAAAVAVQSQNAEVALDNQDNAINSKQFGLQTNLDNQRQIDAERKIQLQQLQQEGLAAGPGASEVFNGTKKWVYITHTHPPPPSLKASLDLFETNDGTPRPPRPPMKELPGMKPLPAGMKFQGMQSSGVNRTDTTRPTMGALPKPTGDLPRTPGEIDGGRPTTADPDAGRTPLQNRQMTIGVRRPPPRALSTPSALSTPAPAPAPGPTSQQQQQ